jgi:alpha/beta hydrolase fold
VLSSDRACLTGSSSSEWIAVQSLISQFARVYSYDRAGYGFSRDSSSSISLPTAASSPTAAKRCKDLTDLLERAGIEPPWVLVGHSYGGTLVRKFAVVHGPQKVVGLVLVDAAANRMALPADWPSLLGRKSYWDVVGLEEGRKQCLNSKEWEQVKKDEEMNGPVASLESEWQESSARSVNEEVNGKQVLGNQPVCVVFCDTTVDFEKIHRHAVATGAGIEETRQALGKRLEDMSEIEERGQRIHLRLSTNSRFVRAEGDARTHNVHMIRPEVVVDAVKWVLAQLPWET